MKKVTALSLILVALLLLAYSVKAQQKLFNLQISNEIKNAGFIITAVQDQQGYIWLGSSNGGLFRYDGSKVISIVHDQQNHNSLANNYVECIVIDSNDIIWLGTRAGLDRYDRLNNTFTHFRHNAKDGGSLSNDTVTALIQDREGNIWVGTLRGLDMLNVQTGKFTHYKNKVNDTTSLSYNDVNVLYEDRQGTLWAGCGSPFFEHGGKPEDGGLNKFDKHTGTFTRYIHEPGNSKSIENNKVRAILEDSKGNFWVGTAGDGLQTLNRTTGEFTHYHYDSTHAEGLSRPPVQKHPWGFDHITFLHEDVKGNIWLGTLAGGINEYNPVTKKVTHFGFIFTPDKIVKADTLSGFKNALPWHALTSKDGLLWITSMAEVYTVNTSPTPKVPYINTNNNRVNEFYVDEKGSFWVATDNGLIRKDTITGKEKKFIKNPNNKHSLNNSIVTGIQIDGEGKFWLGTWGGGLNQFDPIRETFTHYVHNDKKPGISYNFINSLYIDKEKNVWIGTRDSILNKLDTKSGLFTLYKNTPADSSTHSNYNVICTIDDESGNLWVGTESDLERLNKKSGKFQHYLLNNIITNLLIDNTGILWAGTQNGLYYYDHKNDRFILYAGNGGLTKIEYVTNLIEDNKNNLWIGSENVIYKINADRSNVRIYGSEYGVHKNNLNFNVSYKTKNGKLILGDHSGYYAFFPEQITSGSYPAQINITSFQLGDKEIKPGEGSPLKEPLYKAKEISLRYNQNSFSISFGAFHYTSSGEEKFQYMLENYDNLWHDAGAELRAYFFSIPSGHYIFHIRAMNSDGVWSETKLSVIILPPWWQTWWAITLFGLSFIAIVWGAVYYRSRQLRRENFVLEEKVATRTHELKEEKEKVEMTLLELKSTQAQLIQSEKMASLGQLTAGIAHEIQNPLNFVNNFSEVNKELIEELRAEKDNPQVQEEIINYIEQNLDKIIHHGMRADSIVKGMLQHSRANTGKNELVDINALVDECVRLSYHGMRAKDKGFNAEIKTDLDDGIGKVNVVPQDISRVLINLFNNAFYAVDEKKRQLNGMFEPAVSICTKKLDGKLEIRVKDNGNGIPQNIVDKIFQPFFTTKPTGQGTGLGLSLSYDIIKAHGGEITVNSKAEEYTEFVIHLPKATQ